MTRKSSYLLCMLSCTWRPVALAAFALVFSSCLGCTPAPASSPRGAVDEYASAISDGRWSDAYALLSVETRAALSLKDFQSLAKRNEAELQALVRGLRQQAAPPLVTAQVRTKNGEVLTLRYEEGAWRIDAEAIDLYSQREPRVALASFVRAYDHGRYDVLLRFIPDDQTDGLDEAVLRDAWEGEMQVEMEQTVEALRVALETAELELLGDRATLSYGAGGTAELIFERGAWKIENFE